jgi:hypothetical protein
VQDTDTVLHRLAQTEAEITGLVSLH